MRDRGNKSTKKNQATEQGRGVASSRWPVEMIIDRGYALVNIYYGDIDPDFDDGFKNGIHGAMADQVKDIPAGEKWGSVAGWAYGSAGLWIIWNKTQRSTALAWQCSATRD